MGTREKEKQMRVHGQICFENVTTGEIIVMSAPIHESCSRASGDYEPGTLPRKRRLISWEVELKFTRRNGSDWPSLFAFRTKLLCISSFKLYDISNSLWLESEQQDFLRNECKTWKIELTEKTVSVMSLSGRNNRTLRIALQYGIHQYLKASLKTQPRWLIYLK